MRVPIESHPINSFFGASQDRRRESSLSIPLSQGNARERQTGDNSPEKIETTIVHVNQRKIDWSVQSKAKIVIIADSNFRLCSCDDKDYEIHVFPGANLSHANKILDTAVFSPATQDVIIAIGINNRSWNFNASTMPDIRKVANQAEKIKPRLHFLGVSVAALENPEDGDNIKRLNAEMHERFGRRFIKPLPSSLVSIVPTDPYGIHHDKNTVNRILNSIRNHISSLSLN